MTELHCTCPQFGCPVHTFTAPAQPAPVTADHDALTRDALALLRDLVACGTNELTPPVAFIASRAVSLLRDAPAAMPDANCYTLPDGSCIGVGCMHDAPAAMPVDLVALDEKLSMAQLVLRDGHHDDLSRAIAETRNRFTLPLSREVSPGVHVAQHSTSIFQPPVTAPAMCANCGREFNSAFGVTNGTERFCSWRCGNREPVTAPAAVPPEWQAIDTALDDGRLVWVYAPERDGLPAIVCPCAYHPDAGWCVDELREVTHWQPMIPPPAPAATEGTSG